MPGAVGGKRGLLEAVALVHLLVEAVHRLVKGDHLALARGADAAPADGDGAVAPATDLPELAGAVALVRVAAKGDVSLEGFAVVRGAIDLAGGGAVDVGADGSLRAHVV